MNLLYPSTSCSQKIQRGGKNSREYNPEHRVPVQERYPDERRVRAVVKWRIQQGDKGNDEEDEKPGTPPPLRLGCHRPYSFREPCVMRTTQNEKRERKGKP